MAMTPVWFSALCRIVTVRICLLKSLMVAVPFVFSQKERREPAQQGAPVSVTYLKL